MTRTGQLALANVVETEALGAALADRLKVGDIVALSGPLGAGKTTLARGILAGLGLTEEAPSPSYSLVIAYEPPDLRIPVRHVDLYRINDTDEIEELGLDEAQNDAVLLIEWPERLGARSWNNMLELALEAQPDGHRRLTWVAPAAWETRWPPLRP
ncbi:MAG TPA: tRNA (adenosine(37)-N6)-threonylcarbamoyltransferase complex ATPase subunit type 1 TsaE [Sphingomonas sp.]|nr:tRNA (adenosine(37)-N6)-threonylcarbamoyltransferase complex ATPase subunit type 1 TsaE [Sphingomonas sp.]